jgi:hypothetical protein
MRNSALSLPPCASYDIESLIGSFVAWTLLLLIPLRVTTRPECPHRLASIFHRVSALYFAWLAAVLVFLVSQDHSKASCATRINAQLFLGFRIFVATVLLFCPSLAPRQLRYLIIAESMIDFVFVRLLLHVPAAPAAALFALLLMYDFSDLARTLRHLLVPIDKHTKPSCRAWVVSTHAWGVATAVVTRGCFPVAVGAQVYTGLVLGLSSAQWFLLCMCTALSGGTHLYRVGFMAYVAHGCWVDGRSNSHKKRAADLENESLDYIYNSVDQEIDAL